jgi:ribosomal protein S18 acetylase RimI-like enzyme
MTLPSDYQLSEADVSMASEVRSLVNRAYQELSDMGLNYTATYQDVETTIQRMKTGQVFILKKQSQIVATILFSKKNYFTNKNTAYVGQFAVLPEFKRQGLGTYLMDFCEELAQQQGYEGLQLDTAIPAAHLVKMYEKRGYNIVGETHWEGKTYRSYIFEKLF